MSQDAEQPNDAAPKPDEPKVHTATLSEPAAEPGKQAKKPKKERPEPTTPLGKLWFNWVKPIGTVVVIVVVFRSMLLDWNDVPTGSMEPEIHVGDRIAVNRLAYGLQFPLTGPQIGIPFTPVQFDNPLDGIPQIGWSAPTRGDIVTFWNPVTDVRMVKRIVAVPGDTISMNGGQITINGQTASYTDLDAVAEGLPLVTKYNEADRNGNVTPVRKDVSYQSESLLDLTRTVQHIDERWLDDDQFIALSSGERLVANSGKILRPNRQTRRQSLVPLKTYLQESGETHRVFAEVRNGMITIDGQPASYNELAQVMLEDFTQGPVADALATLNLSIQDHRFLQDGQDISIEVFSNAVERKAKADDVFAAVVLPLRQTIQHLKSTLMTSFGPVTLGEDEFYMVGDNRNNSHDSRYFGPVMRSEITGKAFAVAFSFKDNKMLALPPEPAWDRFFKDLD